MDILTKVAIGTFIGVGFVVFVDHVYRAWRRRQAKNNIENHIKGIALQIEKVMNEDEKPKKPDEVARFHDEVDERIAKETPIKLDQNREVYILEGLKKHRKGETRGVVIKDHVGWDFYPHDQVALLEKAIQQYNGGNVN